MQYTQHVSTGLANSIFSRQTEYERTQGFLEVQAGLREIQEQRDLKTLAEESLLQQQQYNTPHIIPKPRDLLIMDDVQGSEIFTSKREDLMVQMTIKHRHIPLSIVFLVQTFHGLPRPIRLNCTIYIVFLTLDEKQLSQIYEHFANMILKDQFLAMYHFATYTSRPHGFLFIDTNPKTPQHRFRNGINKFLYPEK